MKSPSKCYQCKRELTKIVNILGKPTRVNKVVVTEHLRNGKIILFCPKCEKKLPKWEQWRDREMEVQTKEFLREEGFYP